MELKIGDHVAWKWGSGLATGEVMLINESRTEIESKGKVIVRNGSKVNPAITIKHESGNLVLKLKSEIRAIAK